MRTKLGLALAASTLALTFAPSSGALAADGSSADQWADNAASSTATNNSTTNQDATQSQSSSGSCAYGCGGAGQAQFLSQNADTQQSAASEADADQNGVNANVPVTIGGKDVGGGDSSATQDLYNAADSTAKNTSTTNQDADQSQKADSDCKVGCGGSGQAQFASQDADTKQSAKSDADADQNGVNANVPVTIGGGKVGGGDSSADQKLTNKADSKASNTSTTYQDADQSQKAYSDCKVGCGGSGQAQKLDQDADTHQKAKSEADAKQNGVNANVPVTIGGKDVHGGDSSAKQDLYNAADSKASNTSTTHQDADQSQKAYSDCKVGCGGSGQAQKLDQDADTHQWADSDADAKQNGVNANVPVTIGGWDTHGGDSSADQKLANTADSKASNTSTTYQHADQSQEADSDCKVGCGGAGQFQGLSQDADTHQSAKSEADADQHGVNANVPVTIGGKDAHGGDSSASQYAANSATSSASNVSTTNQSANQAQSGGSGAGQAQFAAQSADTWQDADASAIAGQTTFNANAPVVVSITVHNTVIHHAPPAAPAPHACDCDHAKADHAKGDHAKKAKQPKKARRAKKNRKGKDRVGYSRRHVARLR
jgi:hypothetical protein